MNTKKIIITAIFTGILFSSCSEKEEIILPKGNYDNGILVTNEGAFSGGTGTINYISDNYITEVAKIFKNKNNEDLGTIVQSIGFNDDKAYIIANVANKISISNRYTMERLATITTGLNNPRYMAFANGKGYVTNWGGGSDSTDDFIAVIDLSTNTVTSTISVNEGPEQIVAKNNKLYISHKGGRNTGNSITVVDATTNTVSTTITVGAKPDELFFNDAGALVVSCEGKAVSNINHTEMLAKLVKVNVSNNTISTTLIFASGVHPNNMVIENGKIYFSTSNNVYVMDETSSTLPNSSIITTPVYGMSVNDGKIYTTDAKDYTSNGTLKIFEATTKAELKSFTVGIIPGKIYFN